jgi:DNA-binding MarR family transcriptional regulator
LHDRLTAHSARWNLTKGEVNVLATLRSVGSPFELRPTSLQARLLLSSGGISNVLNRLERNGLVERQRDSNDGRSCWVRLTGEGAELAYAFARSWTEAQIDTYQAASPAALRNQTAWAPRARARDPLIVRRPGLSPGCSSPSCGTTSEDQPPTPVQIEPILTTAGGRTVSTSL